jgi:hypothetical protein
MSNIVLVHGNRVMNVHKQSKEGKGKRKNNKLGGVCVVRCYALFTVLFDYVESHKTYNVYWMKNACFIFCNNSCSKHFSLQ